MREIKFRAWVTKYINIYKEDFDKYLKSSKMIRGGGDRITWLKINKNKFEKENNIIYEKGYKKECKMEYDFQMTSEGKYMILEDGYEWQGHIDDSAIIMQYTLFKDSNMKEIYEEDIVETWHFYGIVKFKNGAFCIEDIHKAHDDVYFCEAYSLKDEALIEIIEKIKIIGNIYENPELLNQEA